MLLDRDQVDHLCRLRARALERAESLPNGRHRDYFVDAALRIDDALRLHDAVAKIADSVQSASAGPFAPGRRTQLLTYGDVATQLACSVSAVKRLVYTGELPSIRINGLRRIRSLDVEAFLASRDGAA